jgi:hypothetical protein
VRNGSERADISPKEGDIGDLVEDFHEALDCTCMSQRIVWIGQSEGDGQACPEQLRRERRQIDGQPPPVHGKRQAPRASLLKPASLTLDSPDESVAIPGGYVNAGTDVFGDLSGALVVQPRVRTEEIWRSGERVLQLVRRRIDEQLALPPPRPELPRMTPGRLTPKDDRST